MNQVGTIDPDFQHKTDRRDRFLTALRGALALEDFDGLHTVFATRLTEEERSLIAFCCLRVMHRDNITELIKNITDYDAPQPEFFNTMKPAKTWARTASIDSLKAYGFWAYKAMDQRTRDAFRKHIDTVRRRNG